MTKDVEALFRKINQSDLPYHVFESPDPPERLQVVETPAPAPKPPTPTPAPVATTPAPLSARPAPPKPVPSPVPPPAPVMSEPAPRPQAVRNGRLLAKYAPAEEFETAAEAQAQAEQPQLLSEIFARIALR